ncbi:MAG: slipin family protein [Spirulina sp. SIO3F2]|nr:slipin family protein [Spirulina sp. SIO3F2]
MTKTFYIKPHERGLLFYRSHFQGVLEPGTHRRMGWHWNVKTFDLNQARPTIENLEFLLQTHADVLNKHFAVVRTDYNEAVLVQIDRNWSAVGTHALEVYWRGLHPVQVHRFNLDESIELPSEFVQPLRRFTWTLIKMVRVTEAQIGLLYEQGNFVRPLEPGDYGFWTVRGAVEVKLYDRTLPMPSFPNDEVLIEQHPEFVATYCEAVQLTDQQVAIARHRGKVIAILPPCSRKLFWKGVAIEVIDLNTDGGKLPARLAKELLKGIPEVIRLAQSQVFHTEVPAQFLGLFYENGAFRHILEPGLHAWWMCGRSLRTANIDLRLQTLEVAGQEILSKDKVPLRLNLTAGFRITDPVTAHAQLQDINGYLYKELQFGLRSAVGTKTLDELLEDKGAIDATVSDYIQGKVAEYGINVQSVGVKDIILPGEMKTILASVVEAQKLAQANVIRRREETAATRSMLNTAKVMENNPTALRLKELEVLERIADKIERINVNGGLDSLLTEVIRIAKE